MRRLAAIVLAAGKGKRINAKKVNKVVFPLGNKPMIEYTIDLLEALKINPIIIVVGYAKKSVMDVLKGRVIFAEQRKRLGTAHAIVCGLRVLSAYFSSGVFQLTDTSRSFKDVLVLNGDDSAFYTKEIISRLIKTHSSKNATITFLTIEVDKPEGLGRVIRGSNGDVVAVVEDKDVHPTYKLINEVNPACYVFSLGFLRRNLPKVEKSKVTREYYLTRLIDIAVKNNERIETVRGGKIPWRGINTKEELREARKIFLQAN